jgi:hypothetical protein
MTDEPKKRVMNEAEFAEAVGGWHRETIARLRREGLIDHCKKGRMIWYLPEHVDSFHRRFERKAK